MGPGGPMGMQQRPNMGGQGMQPNMQAQAPLQVAHLQQAPPSVQKQMIGERLYSAVTRYNKELAGKITGMLLEMENNDLLLLLESESQLRQKVSEALRILQ